MSAVFTLGCRVGQFLHDAAEKYGGDGGRGLDRIADQVDQVVVFPLGPRQSHGVNKNGEIRVGGRGQHLPHPTGHGDRRHLDGEGDEQA
ncbi:hypothetical protein [Streptomyces sp. NPDC056785]|uniref:hypothetical protein n=1 Tax=Streptomyces sp. NPDC056785 TaxID=3345944 RepID=UPI003687FCBF